MGKTIQYKKYWICGVLFPDVKETGLQNVMASEAADSLPEQE